MQSVDAVLTILEIYDKIARKIRGVCFMNKKKIAIIIAVVIVVAIAVVACIAANGDLQGSVARYRF